MQFAIKRALTPSMVLSDECEPISVYSRRIVKFEVIEATFGPGSFRRLSQRDHWRPIDAGRFSCHQIFQPCLCVGSYGAWAANYAPHSEAVGLLEYLGLGPELSDLGMCGLSFVSCDDDGGGNFAHNNAV